MSDIDSKFRLLYIQNNHVKPEQNKNLLSKIKTNYLLKHNLLLFLNSMLDFFLTFSYDYFV